MKLKTLVAVAISSMLAASFAHAAPSTDLGDDASGLQASASSSASASSMDNTNIGAIPNSNAVPGDLASNSSANDAMSMNPGGSDDMSADTATGDDDY